MQTRTSYPIRQAARKTIWRGTLVGLVPLGVLAGMVGLALALTALVRAVTVVFPRAALAAASGALVGSAEWRF
jgi:hypothetical protein